MAIATLIAAGRLDDRMVKQALLRLEHAGIGASFTGWIDEGDAADIEYEGDAVVARTALEQVDGADVVVHQPGPREKKLFVADMDSTMIGVECIDELADFAGFKEQVAEVTERAMQGELDFRAALAQRVAVLKGLEAGAIDRCREERVFPNPGARTLVRTMRARGAMTLLVTGGFTAFADPVARDIGFERVLANRLAIADGKLIGLTEGAIVDSAAKLEALQSTRDELGLAADQTLAIGDGANDIPMIEEAGLGVGYRPKPKLAEAADVQLINADLTALLWAQGIPRREWVED